MSCSSCSPCQPASCAPLNFCAPENFGDTFPTLVGPMGPPGGPGTFVPSYALLRLLDPTVWASGYIAWVLGGDTVNDGAQGLFEYNPTSTAADNDGTIIRPSNGIGRWIRIIINGPYNVQWFRAKGNGISNDAAACQGCIDAVGMLGGGEVLFPQTLNGYLLGATSLTVITRGTRLLGQAYGVGSSGPVGTKLTYTGASYAIIFSSVVNSPAYGLGIELLTIVGSAAGKAGIRVGGIIADPNNQIVGFTMKRVAVTGFTGAGLVQDTSTGEYTVPATIVGAAGVFIHRGINSTMESCDLRGNFFGLYEASGHAATTWRISDCYFHVNASNGVKVTDSVAFSLYNCAIESNGGAGVFCDTTVGASALTSFILRDCDFEQNAITSGTYNVSMKGNIFIAKMTANKFDGGGKNGIEVDGGAGCTFRDNIVQNGTVVCIRTLNSQGANYVFGLRRDTNLFNNGTYTLDTSTAFEEFDDGGISQIWMKNNRWIQWRDAANVVRNVMKLDPSGHVILQSPDALGEYFFYTNNGATLRNRWSNNRQLYLGGSKFTSTTYGVTLPNLTRAERNAMPGDALDNGTMIYQTDSTAGPRIYVGGAWYSMDITVDP